MSKRLLTFFQISGLVTLPIGSFLRINHWPYADVVFLYGLLVTLYCLSSVGNRAWLNKRISKKVRIYAVVLMFTPVVVSFIIYPLLLFMGAASAASALFWNISQVALFFICSLLSMLFITPKLYFKQS